MLKYSFQFQSDFYLVGKSGLFGSLCLMNTWFLSDFDQWKQSRGRLKYWAVTEPITLQVVFPVAFATIVIPSLSQVIPMSLLSLANCTVWFSIFLDRFDLQSLALICPTLSPGVGMTFFLLLIFGCLCLEPCV